MAPMLLGNELLLLSAVMLVGLSLGKLECLGTRLGAAAVLFVGLGAGAWLRPPAEALRYTPALQEFGLVLFVYCVGLTSGPGLFSAWRRGGLRLNVAVVVALACGALVALAGGRLLGLDRGLVAGVFCGALTNTPALGAAADRLSGTPLALAPVLAYSITYPTGVLGALLSLRGFVRLRRAALEREQQAREQSRAPIVSLNVRVTESAARGHALGELCMRQVPGVVVSRLLRDGSIIVPTTQTVLAQGDVMTVVGTRAALDAALKVFGERAEEHLEAQRDRVDMRRILVSKREFAACSLAELDLERRFNAQVTRLRRVDVDLVPSPELRLQLGDRLRIVAPSARMREISRFFGDSERELAELDFVALALALCLGLLLARLPLPLFGMELRLGAAGGPLLVALLLGWRGRSGPFVWSMPFEINQVLRELGLLVFLAGVGLGAGAQLIRVFSREALLVFGLGALVTLAATGVALLLSGVWAKAGVTTTLGAASGMQTQPATLATAFEACGRSEQTYVAYALVYPSAMIGKILLAQLLVLFA